MTVSVRSDTARSVHPPSVGLLAQLAVLTLLAATVELGPAGWLAGIAFGVGTWVLLTQAFSRPEARGWGPADTITLARATLIGGVTALVADSFFIPIPVSVLVTAAAAALVLDAVDGQVARRTGTTSAVGARFDMEADAALVLVLSVFVATGLGWWVVLLGLPRYLFAGAARSQPWLRRPLPVRLSRKVVAATQGTVLLVAAAVVLPAPLMTAGLALLLLLLAWSFGRDIGWLWRLRHRPLPNPAPAL